MGSEKIKEDTTTTAQAKDAPALVKKIGRTTYIVRVHFSKTSKETISDKIKRMLKNEIIPNALRAGSPLAASTKGAPKYIDLLESINAKPEETQPHKGIPAIIDWQKKSIQVCKNDK